MPCLLTYQSFNDMAPHSTLQGRSFGHFWGFTYPELLYTQHLLILRSFFTKNIIRPPNWFNSYFIIQNLS